MKKTPFSHGFPMVFPCNFAVRLFLCSLQPWELGLAAYLVALAQPRTT